MNSPISIVALILSLIVVSLAISFILSKWFPSTQWVPIGLSVASILIAVLATFKNDLFDFSPQLIGGDLALIHSSQPDPTKSGILLPLYFVNRGYGEGVIMGIAVEVTNVERNEKYLLTPLEEVDLQKLIQNTGRIHGSNTIGPFLSFPLGSKQVIAKSLVFGWVNDNPKYAQPRLDPNSYLFDVFIQTDRTSEPIKALTIKQKYDQKMIDSFISGNAIYNMHPNPFQATP